MSDKIVLSVAWNWGGRKIVRASPCATVSEVLCCHGFSAVDNSVVLVAHRGRVIEDRFSLAHHGVVSGDRLVCTLRKLPARGRSRALETHCSCDSGLVSVGWLDSQLAAEVARIKDRKFAKWESSSELPRLMLKMRRRLDDAPADRQASDTAVPDDTSMGEDPLPVSDSDSDEAGIGLELCGELGEWTAFEPLETFDSEQPNDSTD